jgi:hypothetical protein
MVDRRTALKQMAAAAAFAAAESLMPGIVFTAPQVRNAGDLT